MKKLVPIALVLAAAAVAALFAFGVISLSPAEEEDVGPPPEPQEGPADTPGSDTRVLVGRAPENRPALEAFQLEGDVKLLMMVGAPGRFNALLNQQWTSLPHIEVVAWTAPPPVTSGSGPPPGAALFGNWEGSPSASTLEDKHIDVVFVHDLDPNDVDDGFWGDLQQKVRGGSVGLMAVGGLLQGKAMLDHVGLRSLLPVKQAKAIEGPELPGVYRGDVPFQVTADGSEHPATRLVQWPSWSRQIWDGTRLGDTPWGTGFCYPAVELAEGSLELVRTDPPTGEGYPAIVVGPPASGRVMWLGTRDLGPEASYRSPAVVQDWRVLVNNWIVWLAGRAPN